jgi:hypothetical protein
MSDYSKSTNFTTKDTLPTGNAGKIVKGTELDTEFTAISSAIASKADISSPSLLGTPTATTATTGTNTTQIATTAFVKTAVDTASAALGTMSTQNKTAVDITGGTIVGITDLTVADGGTGRSTLTDKAVLVGAGTGGITSISPGTSGNLLTSDGTNWASTALVSSGIAKAWVSFNSSGTILKAFNVTSITVRGTGQWTINFTTAMADANYVMSGAATYGTPSNYYPGSGGIFVSFNWDGTNGVAPTTSSCQINTVRGAINGSDGEYQNPARTTVVFFD